MSQFIADLVFPSMAAFLAGLAVLSFPWRRMRRLTLRTPIATQPSQVWKVYNYDPDNPESVALHPRTVSARTLRHSPQTVETVIDLSGGHGTNLLTVEEETVEERVAEYKATRAVRAGGKNYPFGPDNLYAVEFAETADGTLLTTRWRGETVSLWQYFAVWRELRRHDKTLRRICESGPLPDSAAKTVFSWRTALISAGAVLSFLLLFGWIGTLLLLAILLIHEFGHWLAFRMSGHPAPRIMLVPFLGGVATGNHPHKSRFDEAFCALMGPAFSILPVAAILLLVAWNVPAELVAQPGWFLLAQYLESFERYILFGAPLLLAFGAVNALQMLPILPLDGGQVLRAVIASTSIVWGRRILIAMALLAVAGFVSIGDYVLASLAALGGVGAWHMDAGSGDVAPMGPVQSMGIVAAYVATFAVHAGAVVSGLWALDILPRLL